MSPLELGPQFEEQGLVCAQSQNKNKAGTSRPKDVQNERTSKCPRVRQIDQNRK